MGQWRVSITIERDDFGGKLAQSVIDDLMAKFPLPDGVPDAVLNREELADALGTSINTISAWIAQGMPVQQVGGNGKADELRLAHCHAWCMARKASPLPSIRETLIVFDDYLPPAEIGRRVDTLFGNTRARLADELRFGKV